MLGTASEALFQSAATVRTPKVLASATTVIAIGAGSSTAASATFSAPTGVYSSAVIVAIATNGDSGAQPTVTITTGISSGSPTTLSGFFTGGISGACRVNYIIYALPITISLW